MSHQCFISTMFSDKIPVIDLFAGPGGLAEGFFAYRADGKRIFKIGLSIEKDRYAHSTLELRSFFRQFREEKIPEKYYAYLRKEISRDILFASYPAEAEAAKKEAWHAELGSEKLPADKVSERIRNALEGAKKWVLIGGPPCQAYSTAGRSRNKGKEGYVPEEDKRHFLYREYLQTIASHWPSVFVMENVKGLLSAKINGSSIFNHILRDLHDPLTALKDNRPFPSTGYKYRIYSLGTPARYPVDSSQSGFSPADFLVMSENHGIPQARHRVILLGIREDMGTVSPDLLKQKNPVNAEAVLKGLPELRSGLSREKDTHDGWNDRVSEILEDRLFKAIYDEQERNTWDCIGNALLSLTRLNKYDRGGEFISCVPECIYRKDWYLDPELQGVCNHTSRTHMTRDLHRYLFAASFAEVHQRSPTLPDFPKELWPAHKSAHNAGRSGNFSDRFRVQMADKPATTIMSHIARDGHYYIHYDPSQCRSLTVREAARLQTFPDNYFFEGPRTQQYIQVGNAVPPLLAVQIAEIVYELLAR